MGIQMTTSTVRGMKVHDATKPGKTVGKAHVFVFHPTQRKVVGFTVKRPDMALMFHRSEAFVPVGSFHVEDRVVMVDAGTLGSGKSACKKLGVDWDECIAWEGLALVTEDGKRVGRVGEVTFDIETGAVTSLRVDRGGANDALLGRVDLDASYVRGFAFGVGDVIESVENDEDDQALRGALVVLPEALETEALGGLAERAGAGCARAASKARAGMDKAREGVERLRPKADDAAVQAGEALSNGAYKVGEQLGRTRGMFAGFKQAYRDALNDEGRKDA